MDLEEIEQELLAVTSRLTIIDRIISASRMGVDMIPVFQCGHSGLYYPVDYVKEWGRLYGIGLGPDVVSECLDSEYDVAPPPITPDIKYIEQIMHPVRNSKAQMDLDLVERGYYKSHQAILNMDDPWMEKRAMLVRGKQLINPRGRLRPLQAAWDKAIHRTLEVV